MKLICSAEIVNRDHPVENAKRRKCGANLVLCGSETSNSDFNSSVVLYVSTANNVSGTKYKIYGNVEKIYSRFMYEGKGTIRLKEPAYDIIVSEAHPPELKRFLSCMTLAILGRAQGHFQLSPVPSKYEKAEKCLEINSVQELSAMSNLPSTLKTLKIIDCSLHNFDQRILKLENLDVLHIEKNGLKEIPPVLGELRVRELSLKQNELEFIPKELCTGELANNLFHLDVSHNKLKSITPYLSSMKKLKCLMLAHNKLVELPRNIHAISTLKHLNLEKNAIKMLPYPLRVLRLESLNIFGNSFIADVPPEYAWNSQKFSDPNSLQNDYIPPHFQSALEDPKNFPSLLDCAAMSIVQKKVPYTKEDLPVPLVDYLVDHSMCPCSKPVFTRTYTSIVRMPPCHLATTIQLDPAAESIPFEGFHCPFKCWIRVRREKVTGVLNGKRKISVVLCRH